MRLQKDIQWARLEELPNIFEVSNTGLVRNSKTGTVFKQRIVRNYYYVRLIITVNSEKIFNKNLSVHRLVAKAFCGGRTPKVNEVNHIDGNKLNNNSSNLEWVSPKENVQHAIQNGLRDHTKVKYHTSISREEIDIMFGLREQGLTHKAISKLLHIGQSTVTHILNGTRRRYY